MKFRKGKSKGLSIHIEKLGNASIIEKMMDKYHIGIDPIFDSEGKCTHYALPNESSILPAIDFDESCKRFAKYYDEQSQLIDEDTGEFIKKSS